MVWVGDSLDAVAWGTRARPGGAQTGDALGAHNAILLALILAAGVGLLALAPLARVPYPILLYRTTGACSARSFAPSVKPSSTSAARDESTTTL